MKKCFALTPNGVKACLSHGASDPMIETPLHSVKHVERPPASTWVAGSLPWADRRESLSSSTSSLRRLWTWRERSRSHSSTGREDRAWRPERMLVENAVDCLSDGCSALFILWISHPNASGCTLHIQYNTAFLTILKRCRICPNMRVRYPPNVVLN